MRQITTKKEQLFIGLCLSFIITFVFMSVFFVMNKSNRLNASIKTMKSAVKQHSNRDNNQNDNDLIGHPPDKPIEPNEFVAAIGSGAWMITRSPLSRRKTRPLFNPQIPKILAQEGCPGGRLHIAISEELNGENIKSTTLKYIHQAVDSCLDSGMYIVMMVEMTKNKNPTDSDLNFIYKTWDKICYEMRNKSHRLAMVPFIEWHGWQDEPDEVFQKKFKAMQKHCTEIFRKYNLTRIIGYKGKGSSRLNKVPWGFLELDKHPMDNPYFILCGSAASLGTAHHSKKFLDWGINKEYSEEEIKQEVYDFFKPALNFRDKYGTAIFVDHWTAPVVGDEEESQDVENTIKSLKEARVRRAKKRLKKILRDKIRAEKKGNVFILRKYKLSQSRAFISYVSSLIKENGLGGAFQPHTIDYFWDDKTQQVLHPQPGTPEYQAQQIIKNSWGRAKMYTK